MKAFSYIPMLICKESSLVFVFQLVDFLSTGGLGRGTIGTTRYCPISPPLFRLCTIVFPIHGSAQITFIAALSLNHLSCLLGTGHKNWCLCDSNNASGQANFSLVIKHRKS